MYQLVRFLRSLPSLPLYLRLSIFLLGFFICGAFMMLGLLVTNNRGLTPIFAIPVALAAWMFPPRQAALALGSVFLMLIIINTAAVRSQSSMLELIPKPPPPRKLGFPLLRE